MHPEVQPEYCAFHRATDTCPPVARFLQHAGLLAPSPNTPASLGASGGASGGAGTVPAVEVTLVWIARAVNQWGRSVIDPTVPPVDPAGTDERSLRYTVQALWEQCHRGAMDRIGARGAAQWYRLGNVLGDAHNAAVKTQHGGRDAGGRALWWYIAWLHLDRARRLWEQEIGRPLGDDAQAAR